jgi:hypothetical protein
LEPQEDNSPRQLVLFPVEAPSPIEMPSAKEDKSIEESSVLEHSVPFWLDDTGIEIVRATRSWIQYGAVGFAIVCIIIGAVEALLGR